MTLPNFVIAGAVKAGTTSLFYYLGQHPQVYRSPIKETRFFTFDPDNPDHVAKSNRYFPIRTLDAYLAQFDGVQDEKAIGEASPNYLISPHAPVKMKELMPDVRLIFSLRSPVDRLYSKYSMGVASGALSGDVYEVLRPGGKQAQFNRYAPYFRHWLNYFDREQMKIILFEDFKSDSSAVLQSVFRYLEIEDQFMPDTSKRHNVGGIPKNRLAGSITQSLKDLRKQPIYLKLKPFIPSSIRSKNSSLRKAALRKPEPLPEDLASDLKIYYTADVLELQELLGLDLSIWGFGNGRL